MKRVLIIEAEMMHYRVPFYEKLRAALWNRQIKLYVAYSDPPAKNRSLGTTADLPSEYGVKVRAFRGPGARVVFQPLFRDVARANLIIVDHANRFILNHLLVAAALMGLKRVAFWGHARCVSGSPFSEWYKRRTLNWVNWWFAYTLGTEKYLAAQGVPPGKITNVDNCIDTDGLRADLGDISGSELDQVKKQFGIGHNSRVGIFCGTFYSLKSVPLLLEAAKLIKLRIPEFHLLLIGGKSPCNDTGDHLSSSSEWLHSVGPSFGREKARLLKLADVFLLPGAVGLAVLDAFAASLPLITTDTPHHGPEIEYLESGRNGLIVEADAGNYADAVVRLLNDPERLASMRAIAGETGRKYSIDRMVGSFCDGIVRCLQEKVLAADVS